MFFSVVAFSLHNCWLKLHMYYDWWCIKCRLLKFFFFVLFLSVIKYSFVLARFFGSFLTSLGCNLVSPTIFITLISWKLRANRSDKERTTVFYILYQKVWKIYFKFFLTISAKNGLAPQLRYSHRPLCQVLH